MLKILLFTISFLISYFISQVEARIRPTFGYVPSKTRYPWFVEDNSFLCVNIQANSVKSNVWIPRKLPRISLQLRNQKGKSTNLKILDSISGEVAAKLISSSKTTKHSPSMFSASQDCLREWKKESLLIESLFVVKFKINRGSFARLYRTDESYQVFVSYSRGHFWFASRFLVLAQGIGKDFSVIAKSEYTVLQSWADLRKGMLDVVVSCLNERLDWMYSLPPDVNVHLYYKGGLQPKVLPYLKTRFYRLPNYGGESYTYLTHIIQNYNNLARYTFFTVASPLASLAKRASFKLILSNMHDISNTKVICDHFDGGEDDFAIDEFNGKTTANERAVGFTKAETRPFDSWFSKYVNDKAAGPQSEDSCYAGMMVVPRALILSRPLDYYIRLKNLLEEKINPEEAGFCERSWAAIFNSNFKGKRLRRN